MGLAFGYILPSWISWGGRPMRGMRLKPGMPWSQATALPTELMCIWFFVMHACLVYLTNKCLNVSDWCLVLGWRNISFLYLLFFLFFFFFLFYCVHAFRRIHFYLYICVTLFFQPQCHIGEASTTSAVWAMSIKCLAQRHKPPPWPRLEMPWDPTIQIPRLYRLS